MKSKELSSLLIKGTEWFARLAVLNLVWILFSLPILTFVPATYAMFSVLKDWNEGDTKRSVYDVFKENFRHSFKRSLQIGWPFIITGLILLVNLYFFFTTSTEVSWFFVLKYANILLAVFHLFLFFYSFSLSQFKEDWSTKNLVAGAFVLMMIQPLVSLSVGTLFVLMAFGFLYFPAFLFFFSASVPAFIFVKATETGYKKWMTKNHIQGL